MKTLLRASAALLAVVATSAAAQEADDDVILVLGKGLPDTPATPAYSTITLDREAITTTGSGRLEDALGNVAGFQQFRRSDSRSSNPTAQGATLRALGGNASSRALVVLDGVPMVDPFFGYVPFSAVAPETLSRIQVTRGGGSGPFGAGALAGTIALESASARELGLVNAAAFVNDREETSLSATLAPEFGSGYAVISGRWDRGDGFDTTPESQRVAASVPAAYDSWTAGGRVVQKLGDVEVQLRALAFEDNRTLRFAGADSAIEGQDVSLRLVSRGPWQVDAVAYGQWRNFSNKVMSSNTFNLTLDQRDTPAEGQGGKIEVRPPVGGGHTLRLGVDARRSAGDLVEDAYNAGTGALTQTRRAGGENRQFGAYVEDDWELGALTLTGGLRADRYTITDGYFQRYSPAGALTEDTNYASRSDWEVTWRAGALFDVAEGARLRAAVYTGFRLPTLNELYRPFVVFLVTTNANAALLPERLEGLEAGIDLMPAPGVTLQATWFENTVKDAIANVTVGTNTRQRRNLDSLEARGLEFAARAETGAFSFDGTLVLTDAKVVGTGAALELDGNRPAQVPEFAASATLGWRPVEGALLSATLRHVGNQYEDDQEGDVLPAATTVDLYARMPVTRGLSAVARVENLFDETIITRNQGGSMDLGTPLTVWLGINFAM
ncbi:TonB-dependent receptor [Aurantiacibacter xanthus]|uniref:TonB-dependent receptor n=1 Tax=Aurantiacibacter xanthus TaxID=1784712 RepID=A0A3A1P995_9SPHN|nr:TonB-dependent receptor [Aurantiacibacter xanthus]RIV88131.1 TonB-dependent receptor [Aurantiacibacter xanthus]